MTTATSPETPQKGFSRWLRFRFLRLFRLLSAVFWFVTLFAASSVLLQTVPEGEPAASTLSSIVQDKALVAYALIGVALSIGFGLLSPARRAVIFCLCLALSLTTWLSQDLTFSFYRVACICAWLALVCFAVDAVTQNLPLVTALRKRETKLTAQGTDDLVQAPLVPFGQLVRKSLLLWAPALVFLGVGVLLHFYLVRASEELVYDLGGSDRYCTPDPPASGPAFPCTSIAKPVKISSSHARPLSSIRNAEIAADAVVNGLRQQVLSLSEEMDQWSDVSHRRARVSEIASLLHTSLLPPDKDKDEDKEAFRAFLAADPEHARLDRAVKEATQKHGGVSIGPGSMFTVTNPVVILRWVERGKRAKVLREQFENRNPSSAYRTHLARDVGAKATFDQAVSRILSSQPKGESADNAGFRADVRAEFLRSISSLEEPIVQAMRRYFGDDWEVAYDNGIIIRMCQMTIGENNPTVATFACAKENSSLQSSTASPLPFEESLTLTINERTTRQQHALEDYLVKLGDDSFKDVDSARASVVGLYNSVPSALGLKQSRCGLNPICGAGNLAKRFAEKTYKGARKSVQEKLDVRAREMANSGQRSVNLHVDLVRSSFMEDLEAARVGQHLIVKQTRWVYEWIDLALNVAMALLLIKSFLYVLSLRLFSSEGPLHVGFGMPGREQSGSREFSRFDFPADCKRGLIAFRSGIDCRLSWGVWKPWVAPLGRILTWNFFVYRSDNAANAKFPLTDASYTGVRWHLAPGEQVVVRIRNLIAFTDNVDLRTEVSLRLSTILLGRMFYTIATAKRASPGILLLKVKGQLVQSESGGEEFPVDSLKLFDRHCEFAARSKPTIRATLVDGYTLMRLPELDDHRGLVVVGSSSTFPIPRGLISYAKGLMSPL